ncbi:MAG: LysR substrate-binding domain-containing protein [Novosphingobium sp.]
MKGIRLPTNLPTDLLRSFVTVVELGSMIRAAEKLHFTASAVSLQIKRLEHIVRGPVFFRENRQLALTETGTLLLKHARAILQTNDAAVTSLLGALEAGPVRIGMIQDFADANLTDVLARVVAANPAAPVHLKVGSSSELQDLLTANRLELALTFCDLDDPEALAYRETAWIGKPALFDLPTLPLAVVEAPCLFRDQAVEILQKIGRPFEIVVETASISALRAAVVSGLAVTLRTVQTAPNAEYCRKDVQIPSPTDIGIRLSRSEISSPQSKEFARIIARSIRDTDAAQTASGTCGD